MRRRTVVAAALGSAAAVVSPPAPFAQAGSRARGASSLQRAADAVHRAGAPGVAVVLRTPDGTRSAHSGTAELPTGRPVESRAHFRAGSTIKTFLATVVLQLVAERRLLLGDTVERWMPGVIRGNGNDGRRITVRQLLQHTSGLYNYTGVRAAFPAGYSVRGYYENRFRHFTARELVDAAVGERPEFEPGTDWSYSNTNYVVAGMIIERVTDRSWRTEVRDRVIRPLRLTGTTVPGDFPYLPVPFLHGYHSYAEDGRRIDTSVFNNTGADASGDLVTTPRDITRFLTALITGELLRPAELAEMQRTHPKPGRPGHGYGLGLESTPLSSGGSYWNHGGNALGYSSENGVSADGSRSVCVAVNSFDEADPAAQDRVDAAVQSLIDGALRDPVAVHSVGRAPGVNGKGY